MSEYARRMAAYDARDPDPWLALLADRLLPFDTEAKESMVRCQACFSRRFLCPVARPLAALMLGVARLVHMISPRWPHAPLLLHRAIGWGMQYCVMPDANRLILRHFNLGAEILRFIPDNATPGFHPGLSPMRVRAVADVADNLFLKHDLNIYNFLIQLNGELDRRGAKIGRVAAPDFSAISDQVPLDPLPCGRFNQIDLQTAITLYTPLYALLLTERDFSRAVDSLQLDETIGLYVARITGEERHLALISNRHPLLPLSPAGAGFRLMLHGVSTELLHGLLREMKRKAARA